MPDNNQGFAGMSEEERKEAESKGGSNSSGSLKNDPQRASDMGKKGAKAEPTEAKRRGGQNSHSGSSS